MRENQRNGMPYIPNKALYAATMWARRMMSADKLPADIAITRAARHYRVPEADVASECLRMGARRSINTRIRSANIFTEGINMTWEEKTINSDFNTQVVRNNDGTYQKAQMRQHRKFHYDPFAAGEEYVENPWLLGDQIYNLETAVAEGTIPAELIERRVDLLDTAISALATNPYFNTWNIVERLWAFALWLLKMGHLKQAEIIVDRARFVDRVMCRNPNINVSLMHAVNRVKVGVGKFEEAIKALKDVIRHEEKTLGWDWDLAFALQELGAIYMVTEDYPAAAEAYGRAADMFPPCDDSKDEWSLRHKQNQEKLTQLGYLPNPHRRRSWHEVRYLRGMKKMRKAYLAKTARTP